MIDRPGAGVGAAMVHDYYAILGVDPAADATSIAAALAKCQPAWSSGTRNPKNRHTFQAYLDQIPEIRRALLGDSSARAAYDAERLAAIRVERDRLLDALQRLVRLRAAKGGLTVTDRTLLRAEAERLGLSASDLDALTRPHPPLPEAPIEDDRDDEPAGDVLDASMRRQIRVTLGHIRRRDLYDAVDLGRDAPEGEIAGRADRLRSRWMNKSQVTAEKTAWLEATSYVQTHLGTPAARARYDRTLAVEAREALAEAAAFSIRGLRRLDPGTQSALIDEAAALGIEPEPALRIVRRACTSSGVAIDGAASGPAAPPTRPAARWLRCPGCAGLTAFDRVARAGDETRCAHCGDRLKWSCPACQASHWVDRARCDCSFRREDVGPLVRHFEAAQRAFKEHRFAESLDALGRVRALAPKHVGARKGMERVKERLAEIERARMGFEVEFARRALVAARRAVEAWMRLVDPMDEEARRAAAAVMGGIRDAHRLVGRADDLAESDPAAARDLYRQAEAVAADLPEVRDGLRRCPPDRPTALTLSVEPGAVRLRWAAPEVARSEPIRYEVVRRASGRPDHAGDGVPLGIVEGLEFVDRDARAGASFGYAVFSRRGDIRSPQGAAAGPILVIAEVAELRVEPGSRSVDLEWSTPAGVLDVRVVRKSGSPPSGPTDGQVVPAGLGRARDVGLIDDRTYFYGVYALYPGPDGSPIASRGVVASAIPHPPGVAVADLTPGLGPDGRVVLRWSPVDRGEVRILRTDRPPAVEAGRRISRGEAAALGGVWIVATRPGEAIDEAPTATTMAVYTPMTIVDGSMTVGPSAPFSGLADPTDLRVVRADEGGRVLLRWRWNPRAPQTLVVVRAGTPPIGPDDPEAEATVVRDLDYSRAGSFSLIVPRSPAGPCHVRLYSVATSEAGRLLSPGTEPTARAVVAGPSAGLAVSYAIRRSVWPGRSWSISIRTDPPGSVVPPIVLVEHPRTVPLTADDGSIVARLPASSDGSILPLPRGPSGPDSRVRAFVDPLADPSTLPPIRFKHPEGDATRV